MNEYIVFVRGRSEPIRLSAANYSWDPREDINILTFCDESDVVVARLPFADVQAIVNAKHYIPPGV